MVQLQKADLEQTQSSEPAVAAPAAAAAVAATAAVAPAAAAPVAATWSFRNQLTLCVCGKTQTLELLLIWTRDQLSLT